MKLLLLAVFATAAVFAFPQDINSNLANNDAALPNLQKDIQDKTDKTKQNTIAVNAAVKATNAKLDQLEAIATTMEADLDTMWLVLGAALVFLLTIGLGLIEAAAARRSSRGQIFVKNIAIAGIVAIMWWTCGYGVAYGARITGNQDASGMEGSTFQSDNVKSSDNAFVGNGKVFMSNDGQVEQREFANWAYSYTIAVLATIVATSALTDRGTLTAYVVIAVAFSGGIYPIIVHWVWADNGWLSARNPAGSLGTNGMIDGSGSGVWALIGAAVSLVTTYFAGPRLRRFDVSFNKANPGAFQSGNKVYQGLGTIFLWVGFYGLTCVSTNLSGGRAQIVVKVAANTTLAAAGGALLAFILDSLFGEPTLDMVHLSSHPEDLDAKVKRTDIRVTLNGVIAGLVAVAAGVATYELWASFVVGAVGGVIAYYGPRLVAYMGIDDPVDTFSIFGLSGLAGLFSVGWLARSENLTRAYKQNNMPFGIWYGGSAEQWGLQLFGGGAILLFGLGLGLLLTLGLRYFNVLRVSNEEEARGITFPYPNKESEQEMKTK